MPNTKIERIIFALLTVFITVHCFVFYCLAIEMGGMSMNVIKNAYSIRTWVYPVPIIVLEFVLAFACEMLIGSPMSLKLTFRKLNPAKATTAEIERAIINNTVLVMCPLMSFIAVILYKVIPAGGFNAEFIPAFLQTVVINFPFALLSQIYFIQPIVRFLFSIIYRRQVAQAG
ncbi:DUF2798 domain-containing protein [bacterium]|nr:DUF2798 domain-containing protein [bacterium]